MTTKKVTTKKNIPFVWTAEEQARHEQHAKELKEQAEETRVLLQALGLYPNAHGVKMAKNSPNIFMQAISDALPLLTPDDLFSVFLISGRLIEYKKAPSSTDRVRKPNKRTK